MRKSWGFGIVMSLVILGSNVAWASIKRPVEGAWIVRDALLTDTNVHPIRYYVVKGDRISVIFAVDPGDAARFNQCDVAYDIHPLLQPTGDERLVSSGQVGAGFWLIPRTVGTFPIRVAIVSRSPEFTLTYEREIVVVASKKDVPWDAIMTEKSKPVFEATLLPIDPLGEKIQGGSRAPANYAHIWGLAASYDYPGQNRRAMLRGVALAIFETNGTYVATVYSSDATGEANCGITQEDYVTTSTGTWTHVSNSGFFDFGNVNVGSAGKDLVIREYFRFMQHATGYDYTSGTVRSGVLDGENGNSEIYLTWNIGHAASGAELGFGLWSSGFTLSMSNGTNADEAMHVQIDMSRLHRFLDDCTGFSLTYVPAYLFLSDTGGSSSNGIDMWITGNDDGYLAQTTTDVIRHEYSHCVQYQMRSGSMPPFHAGDSNHGSCMNHCSSDALAEGFAAWLPTIIVRDAVFNVSGGNQFAMNTNSNACVLPIPDDLNEWAFAYGMWQGWTNTGATDAVADCMLDSIRLGDPDYVEDAFMGIVADCGIGYDLWTGFHHQNINYDTTPPSNPSPIYVTPNARWTNDTTPTWSWATPADDISGVWGYGVSISSVPHSPDVFLDIHDTPPPTSYTNPTPLADANSYYFNLKACDRALNFSESYTYQGPIGIDTVMPTVVTNLHSTSHTVGVWSNNATLIMSWTAASDARSGLDGYGLNLSYNAPLTPPLYKELEETATTDTWTWDSSALARYYNIITLDNAGNWNTSYVSAGPYYIDAVLPGTATNLTSTSHTPGVWSNDLSLDFTWTAATDAHSGIDGYSYILVGGSPGSPDTFKDMEQATSVTFTTASSASGRYFCLRAVDNAGNWQSGYVSAGPYYIDNVSPLPPSGLRSTTNPVGSCTTEGLFSVEWNAASDAISGLSGYSYSVTIGAPGTPDTTIDLSPASVSIVDITLDYSQNGIYFNIYARDYANNWSTVASYGPFYNDIAPVEVTYLAATRSIANPANVDLSWSDTFSYQYRIERSTTPDFATVDVFTTNFTTWTDTTTPAGTILFYRVKSLNRCGDSSL